MTYHSRLTFMSYQEQAAEYELVRRIEASGRAGIAYNDLRTWCNGRPCFDGIVLDHLLKDLYDIGGVLFYTDTGIERGSERLENCVVLHGRYQHLRGRRWVRLTELGKVAASSRF